MKKHDIFKNDTFIVKNVPCGSKKFTAGKSCNNQRCMRLIAMKNWPVLGGPPSSPANDEACVPRLPPAIQDVKISTIRPAPKPLYPPLGAIVPFKASLASVVVFPWVSKAQPSGIDSPDFARTDISLLATTLAD